VRELALLESCDAERLSADERRWVRLDHVKSLEEAGRYEAAREKLVAMLEDATGMAVLGEFPAKVWLARLDRKAGNDERAREDLRDLLREAERTHRRDGWQVEALAELGKVLFLQGKHDGLVLIQEALGMRLAYLRVEDPKVLEDKVWLAGALRAAGERAEALEVVEDVIEMAGEGNANSDARYPLALAWLEKGEILRANGDIQGALKAAEQGKGVEGATGYRSVRLQVQSTGVFGTGDPATAAGDNGEKTAE